MKTVTKFISEDGQEFGFSEDCLIHEKTMALGKLLYTHFNHGSDDYTMVRTFVECPQEVIKILNG